MTNPHYKILFNDTFSAELVLLVRQNASIDSQQGISKALFTMTSYVVHVVMNESTLSLATIPVNASAKLEIDISISYRMYKMTYEFGSYLGHTRN